MKMTEIESHFKRRASKRMRLETDKQYNGSGSLSESTSDSDELYSDSDGSDLSAEDFPSESDLSSDSTSSEDEWSSGVDEPILNTEEPNTIGENTWAIVHPPEPAIDMKSRFTVSRVGPCNLPKSKNPLDFLSLFLTEEVFTMMVDNTNTYARYVLEHNLKSDKLKNWYDVTLGEMKQFWSILINMGLTQMCRYKDYWSTHPVLSMPFFERVMSFHRFKSIMSMFDVTDVRDSPKSDCKLEPLEKVQSLLTSFNLAFKQFYVPEQEVRLDEGLIYSKRSHCIIQYRPKKYLVQSGIQKLEICDPSSDYIIHVSLKKYRCGVKGKNALYKNVVFDVLNEAELTEKGYHLFIGKNYMDTTLSQKLLLTNTYLTGPVDKTNTEDFPSFVTRSYVKPGTTLYARSGNHLLIKYNVQKPVCLTTGGWAENQSIENAKSQQRVRPLIIRRYLKYMSGKDKSSLHVTCTIALKSFWKKMAFNLVDIAIYNAYLLFKSQKKISAKFSRQKFLEELVEQLSFIRPPVVGPVNLKGHQLRKVDESLRQTCTVCRKQNNKMFFCACCNVQAHKPCFRTGLHKFKKKTQNRPTARQPTDRIGSSTSVGDSEIEVVEIKVEPVDGS